MAFSGPQPLAPGLPGEDGRLNAEVTIELGRIALCILGVLGVGIAGIDRIYVNIGSGTVTHGSGGVWSQTFKTPFPRACLACVVMPGLYPLRLLNQFPAGFTIQRNDGTPGQQTISFIAFGC